MATSITLTSGSVFCGNPITFDIKPMVRAINRVTIKGSIINVVLLIFKFVAGIVGGSAAMIADAVHSLSDFLTDVVVVNGKEEIGKMMFHILKKVFFSRWSNVLVARNKGSDGERF